MMKRVIGAGTIAMLAPGALAAAAPAPAASAAPVPAPAVPATSVPGWDETAAMLRDLPGRLLARLPEAMRRDPQVQQEVARLALAGFTSAALDTLAGDGDHPMFVSQIGQVLNVGQPNADTIYRSTRVTPGGTYRLRGRRGSLRMAILSEGGRSPWEPGWSKADLGPRPQHDLGSLHVDGDGRFDVVLSPARPPGYTGDWWPLQPGTSKLFVRLVSADWAREVDPTLSIERIDAPAPRPRVAAADLQARLTLLPRAAAFLSGLFVDHVETLRAEGYVNRLKSLDVSQVGGVTGQSYYEGAYQLRDDQALIVEAKAPARCLYRSMILTDALYETTDWTDNHSSLNDAQAKVDADGVLRIVVSARDPGVPNWLDTAGNPFGLVQGRWTGCDSQPVPSVRLVPLAAVRGALPKDTPRVTPEARERIIRDRRAAYQQRPIW